MQVGASERDPSTATVLHQYANCSQVIIHTVAYLSTLSVGDAHASFILLQTINTGEKTAMPQTLNNDQH